MNVSLDNYSEGRSKQWNTTRVRVGSLTLYFSYQTVIAFNGSEGMVMRENDWGPTTGKHLNWISRTCLRLPSDEFEAKLREQTDRLDAAAA